jgi:hypothetical protein
VVGNTSALPPNLYTLIAVVSDGVNPPASSAAGGLLLIVAARPTLVPPSSAS